MFHEDSCPKIALFDENDWTIALGGDHPSEGEIGSTFGTVC